MKIKQNEFYTTAEIMEMGIIKSPTEYSKKQMLLRFIREGRLKAKNVGTEIKPRYVVQGKHLQKFINQY